MKIIEPCQFCRIGWRFTTWFSNRTRGSWYLERAWANTSGTVEAIVSSQPPCSGRPRSEVCAWRREQDPKPQEPGEARLAERPFTIQRHFVFWTGEMGPSGLREEDCESRHGGKLYFSVETDTFGRLYVRTSLFVGERVGSFLGPSQQLLCLFLEGTRIGVGLKQEPTGTLPFCGSP